MKNEQQKQLNRLLKKLDMKGRSGIPITDKDVIDMLILASEPLASEDPILHMSKEEQRNMERIIYAKTFSRVIPKKYEPWQVLETCVLPDLRKIVEGLKRIANFDMVDAKKKELYIDQLECLFEWVGFFGILCLEIIETAELCTDADAELAEDFLITGNEDEINRRVEILTDAFDDEDFTYDHYFRVMCEFFDYFAYLLEHTISSRSEDEIYFYHVSMLLVLMAFQTDIMLNRRLKDKTYVEKGKSKR